jgi:hypothetical protein
VVCFSPSMAFKSVIASYNKNKLVRQCSKERCSFPSG